MFRAALAFCVVTLCIGLAAATDITTEWAGVYKERFQNAMSDGERYESENVLEIVRLDAQSAYVRTRVQYANGHSCSLYIVAQVEGDSLIYRETNPPAYREQCVLTLTRAGDAMRFGDATGGCRQRACGARGMFDGAELPATSQRRIRYMSRLHASREYSEAMREAGRTP